MRWDWKDLGHWTYYCSGSKVVRRYNRLSFHEFSVYWPKRCFSSCSCFDWFPFAPLQVYWASVYFLGFNRFLFQNIKTIPILRTSAPDMPQTLCNSMSLEIVGFLAVLPTVVEIRLVLLSKNRSFVGGGLFLCLVESISMHPHFYFCLNSITCQVIIVYYSNSWYSWCPVQNNRYGYYVFDCLWYVSHILFHPNDASVLCHAMKEISMLWTVDTGTTNFSI